MALNKTVSLPCGYDATYHRILVIQYDANTKKANIAIGMYKDKATREASNQPLDRKFYSSLAVADSSEAAAYTALKAQADYSGAEDC